jgi:hypothetical protein
MATSVLSAPVQVHENVDLDPCLLMSASPAIAFGFNSRREIIILSRVFPIFLRVPKNMGIFLEMPGTNKSPSR